MQIVAMERNINTKRPLTDVSGNLKKLVQPVQLTTLRRNRVQIIHLDISKFQQGMFLATVETVDRMVLTERSRHSHRIRAQWNETPNPLSKTRSASTVCMIPNTNIIQIKTRNISSTATQVCFKDCLLSSLQLTNSIQME